MKVQRCEQHKIKCNSDFGKFNDEYCFKSKNLYNVDTLKRENCGSF